MIGLTGEPPVCVTVDGRLYPVLTDYKRWVEYESVVFNPEMSDEGRLIAVLSMFTDDLPGDIGAAARAVIDFYLCGRESKSSVSETESRERLYDFAKDAPYIISAFRQCYSICLPCDMHWWTFRALFEALPDDCLMSKIMGWRAQDLGELKGKDKERAKKLKRRFALDGYTKMTRDERDAKWLDQLKKRGATINGKT
jgi:hypothetical protein